MPLLALTVNTDPSHDLSYASVALDEAAWRHKPHLIASTPKVHPVAMNGNLRCLVPDIEAEEVRKHLPHHLLVDTNTRTVFQDVLTPGSKPSISDHVASPNFRSSSPMRRGHRGMNMSAAVDTRIDTYKEAHRPEIGPGSYEIDPRGMYETGPLHIDDMEMNRTGNYARDPTKASRAFLAPGRGETAPEVSSEAAKPPHTHRMPGPDYAAWTNKGFHLSHQPRLIEAERWGESAREPKATVKDQSNSLYDPQVAINGRPATCQAYCDDPESPKGMFRSSLPRLMGLSSNLRVVARTQEAVSCTTAVAGPGSYLTEAPRFRSANACYENSTPYYSLASGQPRVPYVHDLPTSNGSLGCNDRSGAGGGTGGCPSPTNQYHATDGGGNGGPRSPTKGGGGHAVHSPPAHRQQVHYGGAHSGHINPAGAMASAVGGSHDSSTSRPCTSGAVMQRVGSAATAAASGTGLHSMLRSSGTSSLPTSPHGGNGGSMFARSGTNLRVAVTNGWSGAASGGNVSPGSGPGQPSRYSQPGGGLSSAPASPGGGGGSVAAARGAFAEACEARKREHREVREAVARAARAADDAREFGTPLSGGGCGPPSLAPRRRAAYSASVAMAAVPACRLLAQAPLLMAHFAPREEGPGQDVEVEGVQVAEHLEAGVDAVPDTPPTLAAEADDVRIVDGGESAADTALASQAGTLATATNKVLEQAPSANTNRPTLQTVLAYEEHPGGAPQPSLQNCAGVRPSFTLISPVPDCPITSENTGISCTPDPSADCSKAAAELQLQQLNNLSAAVTEAAMADYYQERADMMDSVDGRHSFGALEGGHGLSGGGYMPREQGPGALVFLRRHVPVSDKIHTQLAVAADLRRARQQDRVKQQRR